MISKDYEMLHTFMHAHIPNPKFMVMAEMSTFGFFQGRNVRGRNVQAEMSVAEMSEHRQNTELRSQNPLRTSG